MSKIVIDTNVLRQELSVLNYGQLEEKYIELGFKDIWKKGANKQTALEKLIGAIVEKNGVVEDEQEETLESQKPDAVPEAIEEEGIPVGEWDVDEDLLDEFPELVAAGFTIGDVLVHEEGKPFYRKNTELNESLSSQDTGSEEDVNITVKGFEEEETTEEESEDQKLFDKVGFGKSTNTEEEGTEPLKSEEKVYEYEPEVIDETKFSVEELEENLQLCMLNAKQALPSTRITLLRKAEAIQVALDKKK